MTPVWERAVDSVTARAFCKLLSIYLFSYIPFGFEDKIWDLIVSVPDYCFSFYFTMSAVPVIFYWKFSYTSRRNVSLIPNYNRLSRDCVFFHTAIS